MALPVASIPVLTGEVGRQFEAMAEENMKRYLNRTPSEVEEANAVFAERLAQMKRILAKSKLS